MILQRALGVVAAAAAMAAAAGVAVVAAAFALYALVREYLSPAGAAAVIALLAAVLAVILAFVAYRQVRARRPREEDQSVTARLIDLARERPIIAAGAAVAAGFLLLRNPSVVPAAISAVMASRATKAEHRVRRERRR